MLRGHSAKAIVDLSCGQGSPLFCVRSLSSPWEKMEMMLTEFVLTEMRREGSSHYRPEAAQEPPAEMVKDGTQPKKQKSDTAPKGEPKPKKPRKTSKKEDETEEVPVDAGAGGEEDEGKKIPLPW